MYLKNNVLHCTIYIIMINEIHISCICFNISPKLRSFNRKLLISTRIKCSMETRPSFCSCVVNYYTYRIQTVSCCTWLCCIEDLEFLLSLNCHERLVESRHMATRNIDIILNQLGWQDGFRIPIANEENKCLEEEVNLRHGYLARLDSRLQPNSCELD